MLSALFEGLNDAAVPYRLAIAMNEQGEVSGDVPYIDDSFTIDEALDAADEMLAGRLSSGDNDAGLQTCGHALEENRDWLFDDGDVWLESRLNVMVITYDIEQSPGNAKQYVNLYDDYKPLSDLAVHSVAGNPLTGGCHTSGGVAAVGSPNLWEAVEMTGGVFISFCDPDWTKSAPALVDGFTGGIQMFVLDGDPEPSSIEVRVDGALVPDRWRYEEKSKELVFDDGWYPASGAVLRVDYLMAMSCE